MTTKNIDIVVHGLLNGKKPGVDYLDGESSEKLASALAARIDAGVAPSLCAHAMCCSSAAGNVAVVRMLSQRPMSTFNKAYKFGEPLRRACRAFAKTTDPIRRNALAECARLIVIAKGDLNEPDKYLKSGLSAAESLLSCGSSEALSLLEELKSLVRDEKDTVTENKNKKLIIKKIKNENLGLVKEGACQEVIGPSLVDGNLKHNVRRLGMKRKHSAVDSEQANDNI